LNLGLGLAQAITHHPSPNTHKVDLLIWNFVDLKICPTYNFQIRNFQIPN
jgi:hypothetical protein